MWKISIYDIPRKSLNREYYFESKNICEKVLNNIINRMIRGSISFDYEKSDFYEAAFTNAESKYILETKSKKIIFEIEEVELYDNKTESFEDLDNSDDYITTLLPYNDNENYYFYLKWNNNIAITKEFIKENYSKLSIKSFAVIDYFEEGKTYYIRFNKIRFNSHEGIFISQLYVTNDIYLSDIKLDEEKYKDLYSKVYKKYTELNLKGGLM